MIFIRTIELISVVIKVVHAIIANVNRLVISDGYETGEWRELFKL